MEFLTQQRFGYRRWIAGLTYLALCAPVLQGASNPEYVVKAAFVYKFASFVQWPDRPGNFFLNICITGHDPFGGALERVINGKTVSGRRFQIRRLKRGDGPGDCQILFISSSERKRLPAIFDALQGSPTLTVGDVADFCESGGAINLTVVDTRVQLEINPAAVDRAGLQLSSRLMSLARIVRSHAAEDR